MGKAWFRTMTVASSFAHTKLQVVHGIDACHIVFPACNKVITGFRQVVAA